MRRLLIITAAIAALAQAGSAWAHDDGRHGRGERSERSRRDDGPPRSYDLRSEYAPRGDAPRGDDRRRAPYPALRDEGPPPGPARRGGYLPERYRGDFVDDYPRYRLRPPPRGYAWVRVNGGFALVSVDDGRIFDVIPD